MLNFGNTIDYTMRNIALYHITKCVQHVVQRILVISSHDMSHPKM
jgi:hypothetical protein